MNNFLLQSMAVGFSIISVMSLENLFNDSGRFNGPAFNSNALSCNVLSINSPCDCCCNCCNTCIKSREA